VHTSNSDQKKYYADDFQWSDSQGGPVTGKEDWFRMSNLIRTAMPDAGYVIDDIHKDGEDVIATGHFTGTFKNDLDLTSMNLGVIKATGRKLKFPVRTSRVSFSGDQIIRNHSLSSGPTDSLTDFLAVFKES
jgi:predicted ester cyclase